MALVLSVIFSSILSGSMQKLFSSTSTNTGIELFINMQVALDVKEYGVTKTSSPGLTPQATTAACKQAVAEFIATAYSTPKYLENNDSNSLIFFPPRKYSPGEVKNVDNSALFKTSKTALFSSSPIIGQ